MINPNSQTSQTILERQHAVLYGNKQSQKRKTVTSQKQARQDWEKKKTTYFI